MLRIIIVNWNAGQQLRDCISSIALSKKDNITLSEVVVIDNASTDISLQGMDGFNIPVRVIRNRENIGFAAACNQGASESTEDYLLFLNPDTRLFENSIDAPIAYIERSENENVGIVGIQLVDENSKIACTCSRFPSLSFFLAHALGINRLGPFRHFNQSMAEWAHDSIRRVDQVIGAFFLIRRSAFGVLGGFDPRFFVYFEEVDLSYRAHKIGLKSVYLPEAQAFHAGGGTSNQVKAHRLFYSLRSRLLYGFKHFKPLEARALLLVTLILEPCSRLLFLLSKGSWQDARFTLQGYAMLFADLYNILRISRNFK
jgi:hypothetical protein